MSDPRVTVVVPFYNAERHMEECVDALLRQTFPEDRSEFIMVDNNSTDASAQIVGRYPEIRLLHESKQGAYSARNRALAAASGEIVAFTDPDCVASPEWLACLDESMQDEDIGVVIGGYQPPNGSSTLGRLIRFENAKEQLVFASENPSHYYGHTNNMAVRRRLFEEVGPFVERRRGADAIFVRQVIDRHGCGAVRYCPAAQVRHLEFHSVAAFIRKRFVHGRSSRALEDELRILPLPVATRLELVAQTTADEPRWWTRRAMFAVCAAATSLSWQAGRLTARRQARG